MPSRPIRRATVPQSGELAPKFAAPADAPNPTRNPAVEAT